MIELPYTVPTIRWDFQRRSSAWRQCVLPGPLGDEYNTFDMQSGESMATVCFRLTEVRKQRKLSPLALAQIAGVRLETIQSLEAGTARALRFATLARICEVLHCQPGDLFEVPLDDHVFPVLGGPDEDQVLRERITDQAALLDGPTVMTELVGRDARTLG